MAFRKKSRSQNPVQPCARESETEPGDRLVLEVHVDVELVDLTAEIEGLDRAGGFGRKPPRAAAIASYC